MDWLLDPLRDGITQRALLELAILGVVCGPLGVWVVLYRQSFAAESVAHAMLPGLVLAALASVPLGLGAAAGLAVAVVCIGFASRQTTVGADVGVAVTVTTLFGAGTLLALSPDTPLRLGELLFGDPLSVSTADLIASGCLALVGLIALAFGNRSLTLSGFDPQSAGSLGAVNARSTALLLGLLALTILIAVQALGNLLVVAIVIAPAAAALRLCSSLRSALTFSAAAAIGSGFAGIYLSYHADVAAGAAIALCAIAVFVVALLIARLRPPPSATTTGLGTGPRSDPRAPATGTP